MILYHVSANLNHSGVFYPRVPEMIRCDENDTIQRICVSSSINGCFSAMPFGGDGLDEEVSKRGSLFKVFKFDTDLLSISDSDIVLPDVLVKNELVEDAILTQEHWIMVDTVASEEFIISVSDWTEECDDIFPFDIVQSVRDGKDGYELFWEIYEDEPTTITLIRNLEFQYFNEMKVDTKLSFDEEHMIPFFYLSPDNFFDEVCLVYEDTWNSTSIDFWKWCEENELHGIPKGVSINLSTDNLIDNVKKSLL